VLVEPTRARLEVVADVEAGQHEVGPEGEPFVHEHRQVVPGFGARDTQVDHFHRLVSAQFGLDERQEVVPAGHDADRERVADRDNPAAHLGRTHDLPLAVVEAARVQLLIVVAGAGLAAIAVVRVGIEEKRGAHVIEEPQRALERHEGDRRHRRGLADGRAVSGRQQAEPGEGPGHERHHDERRQREPEMQRGRQAVPERRPRHGRRHEQERHTRTQRAGARQQRQ